MKKLFGVISAMTTPFTAEGSVDVAALEAQTEFLIGKGVQCLYPCGTTGEMYLMSAAERELVAETVVKKAAGRVTVFIHAGAMTEDETIRLARHAHSTGADDLFLPCLVCGCDGVVSGCSGPFPEAFVDVYKAFQAGDLEAARKAQVHATELVKLMAFGGDMSIFKNILNFRGVPGGYMRKPLLDLTGEQVAELKKAVAPYLP